MKYAQISFYVLTNVLIILSLVIEVYFLRMISP